jgi:hypothetical protein
MEERVRSREIGSLPHVVKELTLRPDQARSLASRLREDLHFIRQTFRPQGLDRLTVDQLADDLRILLWHEDTVEAVMFAFYSPRNVSYMGMSGWLVAAAWVYHIVWDTSQLDPIENQPIAPPQEAYAVPFDIFVRFTPRFLRLPSLQRAQRLRGLSGNWRENDVTLLAVRPLHRDAVYRAGAPGLVRSSYVT